MALPFTMPANMKKLSEELTNRELNYLIENKILPPLILGSRVKTKITIKEDKKNITCLLVQKGCISIVVISGHYNEPPIVKEGTSLENVIHEILENNY